MEKQHKSAEKFNDICTLKHNLLHYVMGETAKGMSPDPTEVAVLGEYIDMIKDLAEAEKSCQEACYYESVVQAMDESGMIDERMGYNPNRNARGQYSDGRAGNRSGGGNSDSGSSSRGGNSRMGYMPDPDYSYMRMMDEDWEGDENRYGKSFDRFRRAKRHYTRTHSEEDKQKMKEASNEHMVDAMATIREIWDGADTDQKKRMKVDLTNLVQGMTA